MCANYKPARFQAMLRKLALKIPPPDFDYPEQLFPRGVGPVQTNIEPGRWTPATFGLYPPWADATKRLDVHNARSETVSTKNTYRTAWKKRQHCLIPCQAIYEPFYSEPDAKSVRWRIERADGELFCLAGLWEHRPHELGALRWSMTMLTINAETHPLMSRFHRWGDEKRSVVILDESDYEAWLHAETEEDARALLRPFDPDLMRAEPDPLPPRKRVKDAPASSDQSRMF